MQHFTAPCCRCGAMGDSVDDDGMVVVQQVTAWRCHATNDSECYFGESGATGDDVTVVVYYATSIGGGDGATDDGVCAAMQLWR